jgi:hypothetical protein
MSAPEFVNTEIPRDRYGRPMVLQPGSTKRVAYRRVTTFVDCLENQKGGQHPEKKKLNELASQAKEYALAGAAANTGTALHALTERIDRGQPLGVIPAEYEADIAAYQAATQNIEWLGIESFRVYDHWQVAGTADRIGKDQHGRIRIYDIKTGSIDYPHKMAMQLAMYARGLPYDIATDKRGNPEALDLNRGVIIHLPAGEGRCDLYEIDITSGWGACLIAHQVWKWRATKDLVTPIGELSEKPFRHRFPGYSLTREEAAQRAMFDRRMAQLMKDKHL